MFAYIIEVNGQPMRPHLSFKQGVDELYALRRRYANSGKHIIMIAVNIRKMN